MTRQNIPRCWANGILAYICVYIYIYIYIYIYVKG
jgi:hypothetical protein